VAPKCCLENFTSSRYKYKTHVRPNASRKHYEQTSVIDVVGGSRTPIDGKGSPLLVPITPCGITVTVRDYVAVRVVAPRAVILLLITFFQPQPLHMARLLALGPDRS
jgi:hypothetical protein